MPYKGEMHIEFPLDEYRNVVLVFGDNMRGKTSLLNAIRWGFYGRAVGRHSQTIGPHEIINKEAALEADWAFEVRIKFDADGHMYDLRRRAEKRATVSAPQRAEDFQSQVHLSEDGIPVQGDLIDAKINNIAPKQVSRFFLFDGELLQEYETLLIEGSDQGRQIKEAIEQVLGVPALINGRDELGVILKSALKAQQQDLQRTKGSEKLAEQQASLIARQDFYEHDLQALVARLEMIKAERVALDDDIDASQAVYNAKIRLDSLTEQRNSIDALREQKRKDRLDLLGAAWRDLVELKISVRRDQLEARRSELAKQVGNQAVARHQIAQLQELLKTDLCPTCKQDLSEDRRAEIGGELGRLEGELQNLRDTSDLFQELSAQIGALNKISRLECP